MATARDLIRGSLRLLGVLASGENASANDQADALSVLNDLLDGWSTENLTIYSKTKEEFPLIPGQQGYTFGPLGDFSTLRPVDVEMAFIKDPTTKLEIPVEVITEEQWANISVKTLQSPIPKAIFAENTYPLETLLLWPVPSVAKTLVLWTNKPLARFVSANDTFSFPPGYARALRFNLALELAPEYGKEPSQALISGAMESKENLKRQNIKPQYLRVDEFLTSSGSFNWLTGQ